MERPSKGRGAILKELLQKHKEAGQPAQPPPPSESGVLGEPEKIPPKCRGRAATLQKLQEQRQRRAGGDAPPVSTLEKSPSVSTSRCTSAVESITSRTELLSLTAEPCEFRGTAGQPISAAVNYIRLEIEPDRGVFEYEVRFHPDLDAQSNRIRLVNDVLGELRTTKVFDGGSCLYLPHQLSPTEPVTSFQRNIPNTEDQPVTVTLIFKRKKRMAECLHLYNVLFKRMMAMLLYSRMGKNYFNPQHKHPIPIHKLEVYPGYAVSVDEMEGGLMICLDTQHRVVRSQTAYELLVDVRSATPKDFKNVARQHLVGTCILNKHNNLTYTVSDIDFDMSPKDHFTKRGGEKVTYVDYYKQQYNITIKDHDQPMLISKKKDRSADKKAGDDLIYLVPELSFLTGLTDSMRSDFKVMKDVAAYTRITPNQRMLALRQYVSNVSQSERCRAVLAGWGLRMSDDAVRLQARVLPTEKIYLGGGPQLDSNAFVGADWNKAIAENRITGPVDFLDWQVYYTRRDQNQARDFVELCLKLAKGVGCVIRDPQKILLDDDRTDTWLHAMQRNVTRSIQVAVFVCPTLRADRYSIIKTVLLTQMPIASQVVLSKTLSNPSKFRTIVHKIVLQMTCKLGGNLWTLRIPFTGWMIIGIDVYHSKGSKSVCGFVASTANSLVDWYSEAIFQEQELGDFYKNPLRKALQAYRSQQGAWPSNLIIYRDGVGDGQLEHAREYEASQFKQVINELEIDCKITFVVIQKRINTRIYECSRDQMNNPPPGTVVDHTVTKRNYSDFYLVPQLVRQGTVNPTHYVVILNEGNLKADHLQRLSYKLCHLYYNWCGAVRVPAPCQYAHKLAGLVGQYVKKTPSPELSSKLYYL